MRRWYRSGAFPVHRHSLVQLLVDGGLVALAYMLAFELRFDNGIPRRYALLRDDTILWVVPLCIVVFASFGLYQQLRTYVGPRDYQALLRAVVASAILVGGRIRNSADQGAQRVELAVGPMGVAAMWSC
jgi:FlaA1/EpsC-like NDP-sugar epimerase